MTSQNHNPYPTVALQSVSVRSSFNFGTCYVLRVCVKCGNAGSNTCKMRETVRGISRILNMVNLNSDPLNGVLDVTV